MKLGGECHEEPLSYDADVKYNKFNIFLQKDSREGRDWPIGDIESTSEEASL